jgi:hypothetical protein
MVFKYLRILFVSFCVTIVGLVVVVFVHFFRSISGNANLVEYIPSEQIPILVIENSSVTVHGGNALIAVTIISIIVSIILTIISLAVRKKAIEKARWFE